jgi:UDP-N-acetyl-2-amino-2-deoxyglucuronate dehydrogenase
MFSQREMGLKDKNMELISGHNFILAGAAGYIAPRHLKAIKETDNNLLAVIDPHDSVGILDSFFPDVCYFREFERFDRHVGKLVRSGTKIDYLSVCSPNFLHDSHIRFGLRSGVKVICEKPLVIKPHNCIALRDMEDEIGGEVNCIMQLRLHPSVIKLKNIISESSSRHKVDLTYHTSRGPWYTYSWKGNEKKSGGLLMNIGIHFFDMLLWIFGKCYDITYANISDVSASGKIILEKADVNWSLSVDKSTLPDESIKRKERIFRALDIDGSRYDFTDGFTDLHTRSYEEILKGRGFTILDCYPSIELVDKIKKLGYKNEIFCS